MNNSLEYENLDILTGLVDELKLLMKKETSLQNSINNSVDKLNDYNILQDIKNILKEKEQKNVDLKLTLDEQKNVDTLLLPKNVLQMMKLNYPSIFEESSITNDFTTPVSVEEENEILKKLLQKTKDDNNILINHLQTDQINGTLVVVNEFKLLVNKQLEKTLAKLSIIYKQEIYPLEDKKINYENMDNINSLSRLKSFYQLLKQIESEMERIN